METGKNNVSKQSATILVVKDCSMNQMLLEIMLLRLNHKVIFAYGGQEALEILQETPVDTVSQTL